MPIECDIQPSGLTDERFHDLDYGIMGIAFDIHNRFGRLHIEKVYQTEFADRCESAGHEVRREVPIKVSFQGFSKAYYMDVVINNAVDYELKVVNRIAAQHKTQTLSYLMLAGLKYGNVINFGHRSVESWYSCTNLTHDKRKNLHYETDDWIPQNETCHRFLQLLRKLLDDLGGFLELGVYRDALSCVLGGRDGLERTLDVICDGRMIGREPFTMLSDRVALEFTALTESLAGYKRHLRRKYALVEVDAVHWVNFERDIVSLMTLEL